VHPHPHDSIVTPFALDAPDVHAIASFS